jgi:hypothetical protein
MFKNVNKADVFIPNDILMGNIQFSVEFYTILYYFLRVTRTDLARALALDNTSIQRNIKLRFCTPITSFACLHDPYLIKLVLFSLYSNTYRNLKHELNYQNISKKFKSFRKTREIASLLNKLW